MEILYLFNRLATSLIKTLLDPPFLSALPDHIPAEVLEVDSDHIRRPFPVLRAFQPVLWGHSAQIFPAAPIFP